MALLTFTDLWQKPMKGLQNHSSSQPFDLLVSLVAVVLIRSSLPVCWPWKSNISCLPFCPLECLMLWCTKSLEWKQLNKQTRTFMFFQSKCDFQVADKLVNWQRYNKCHRSGAGQPFKESGHQAHHGGITDICQAFAGAFYSQSSPPRSRGAWSPDKARAVILKCEKWSCYRNVLPAHGKSVERMLSIDKI